MKKVIITEMIEAIGQKELIQDFKHEACSIGEAIDILIGLKVEETLEEKKRDPHGLFKGLKHVKR